MTLTTDREIVLTRTVAAPRHLVWQAFTDPVQVAQWWGPDGFTNTVLEMDVRPGGVWRLTMHGPDGTDYPNRIDYLVVQEPERLEYLHGDDGASDLEFHTTITFDVVDGGTLVTLRTLFATAELRDQIAAYAIEGGNQTLGRLVAFLATRQP